jgi:citrate lyase subunit beta / citryl-CoA lyase
MNRLSPQAALWGSERPLPALPACVHYAGRPKFIEKALALQAERGGDFDISTDCEDGAPVGAELEHARAMAALIASEANRFDRVGARVHDVHHPCAAEELAILLGDAGDRIAFLTTPKPESVGDVELFLERLALETARRGLGREIPVSVMIETHGGVHDAWAIAALPGIVSLDFGTMDFVSAYRGAIPLAAMDSPLQFDHPLVRRAKCEAVAAALAHAVVPAHGVTRALDDPSIVSSDARRARTEFGFLRMWSIHPSQIEPILASMRPSPSEIDEAATVLAAAQAADWAPIRVGTALHDRASYRYAWSVLQQAKATGAPLPAAGAAFFPAERR